MLTQALGTIEVYGLPAAIAAADVACKAADVKLIGYETTDGMGMVAVKIEGQVSAVQSSIQAARAAASTITKVFATSVIPRPSSLLDRVVLTDVTVGLESPEPVVEEKPAAAESVAEPEPTVVEPVVEPTLVEEVPAAAPAAETVKIEAPVEPEKPAAKTPAKTPAASRTRKAATSASTTRPAKKQ